MSCLRNFRGMPLQPLEPFQLGVEFRSRLRIAVRQIEASDEDAVDGGFDIARLVISAVTRQRGADQHRIGLARQDGDAVPGLLSAPDRAVAGLLDRMNRKIGVGRFQLLQANHIGPGGAQPAQQIGQAPVDVVDIECRNLHGQTGACRLAQRRRSHVAVRVETVPSPFSSSPADSPVRFWRKP